MRKRKRCRTAALLGLVGTLLLQCIQPVPTLAATKSKLTVKSMAGETLKNGDTVTDEKIKLSFSSSGMYYQARMEWTDDDGIVHKDPAYRDYEDITGIKVLEICPSNGVEHLTKWFNMDVDRKHKGDDYPLLRNKYDVNTNGEATLKGGNNSEGIFDIYYCTMTEFNKAHNKILKRNSRSLNGWNYDIICFGFNDANAAKSGEDTVSSQFGEIRAKWLDTGARDSVKTYMENGGGIVFGHDTIVNNYVARGSYTNTMVDVISNSNNNRFRSLAGLCGMKIDDSDQPILSTSVTKQKTGLLTTYPFPMEDKLSDFRPTHSLGQVATKADVWYELDNSGTPYLMTYKNTAFTQAGHTAQDSMTKIEKQLLANTVFYVNQFLLRSNCMISVPDMAAPDKPSISNEGVNYEFDAEDNGTKYKITGYLWDKDSTDNLGNIDKADEYTNTISITSETGVKEYYYLVDSSKNTVITPQTRNVKRTTNGKFDASDIDLSSTKYLHVIAVDDNIGNYSKTATVKMDGNYKIKYYGNGGKNSSGKTTVTQNQTYGDYPFNLMKNPFKHTENGYVFKGWKENKTDTEIKYKDKAEINKNLAKVGEIYHLYAHWEPNTLKIVYKPNGGTGSDVEANYTYNESITVLSNQWFSKQFYHFTGWNTSADGRGDAYNPNTAIDWNTISFDKNGQATLILYAQWLPNTFTIRYEPNGGNESPVTESYTYNKNITTASNTLFTRKGYYYDFWNTNSDGNGADYAPNTNIPWSFLSYDVNGHASMTLYAKWKPNIYTIRFHPNGGEGHMDDIKPVSYDTSVELPKCSYTKENEYGPSSFKGWNIVGDTKDYIFDDKATVKNVTELLGLENEKDVVVTLYAIWDDCPGIKSKDLYYTLEQAQSGYITEDELLNQAKAFDLEDNEIAPGTHENNSFRVMDYQESDFTKFEHSGSVTETYKVIDSYGNSYKEQITVYIVDTIPDPIQTNSDNTEKEGTTRFIDEKYYRLPYEQGGLQSNSIWLVDVEYRKSIENAFDNIKNSTPEALYEFSHGEILEMKEFVKLKGIGNTKEDSALQQFYNKFF